jgi:KDO2-lipid IV(A) lauroyltransferase
VASPRRLKQLAVFVAYRLGAGIVGLLPESVAVRLGEWAGWLAWTWADRRKDMALRHMGRVVGEGDRTSEARAMFSAYGRYWAEVLWMRPRRAAAVHRRVTTDGLERVLAARDAGTGMIYALPHIGNWEVAGTVAEHEGIELVAVAEKLTNRRLAEWFIRLRRMLGIEVVLADGSPAVMRHLFEVIRRGGAVALVTDRDLSHSGVEVEFFGEVTTLPVGGVALAIRTGAPIFPVASYFADGRGHHVVVEPALEIPSEGTLDERVQAGVQALARALEGLIRREPTQWHLVQPNWPSDRGRA